MPSVTLHGTASALLIHDVVRGEEEQREVKCRIAADNLLTVPAHDCHVLIRLMLDRLIGRPAGGPRRSWPPWSGGRPARRSPGRRSSPAARPPGRARGGRTHRGRRVEGDVRPDPERAGPGQRAVQVPAGLLVDDDRLAPRLGEGLQPRIRVLDHEVGLEGHTARARQAATTSAPKVRLGTNRPSMMSHWMRSTPARSSSATS
jgi:hypothetical protein